MNSRSPYESSVVRRAISHLYAAASAPARADLELTHVANLINRIPHQQVKADIRDFASDIKEAGFNLIALNRIKDRLDDRFSL